MRRCFLALGLVAIVGVACALAPAAEKPSAERGRDILLGQALTDGVCSTAAYDNAWKQWGLKEKPADYARAFRDRYGLFEAPYQNKGLPMGFREAPFFLGKGLTNDCLLCHAGKIAGQTVIGLPNASLDLQSLYDDLFAYDGTKDLMPVKVSHVRGGIDANVVVFHLMQYRDPDLSLRAPLKHELKNNSCQDIPNWWNIKKKKTMYATGAISSRAVRSMMPFLLSPFNSAEYIKKQEPRFADIKAYLLTLEPPKYPFPVDEQLALKGKAVFSETCAKCHGTYGPGGSYPNKIVPFNIVGTDRTATEAVSAEALDHFVKSWFLQEPGLDGKPLLLNEAEGFQAPPLDGVWATAPYLHNGSVPTVYHMLNSKARPKVFTRSYRTEKQDYDPAKLGWKITELERVPSDLPVFERRKIYDTTEPGKSNAGHPFGDKLTEDERLAVIEYLKTL